MTINNVLLKLSREDYHIEPGQPYIIDMFRPEDALGVARCFFAVYGDAYSIDMVYSPEALIEANKNGKILAYCCQN
jgi:hypothetical protein